MEGENIIITGANRGIGKELVKVFAEAGANIWACMRKENEDFISWKSELEQIHNVWIKTVCFDITDSESFDIGIKSILDENIKIDVLINNAGIPTVKLLNKSKLEEVKALFNVNYFSMLNMIQKISKKMVRQKSGVIINMGSIAGIEPQPGKIAYGSSKAAVLFMTQCLAKELGPLGIRVNAIAPGPIETEMIQQYNTEQLKQLSVESSLRRLGKTEEIAQVALFLASERASYINGAIIKVDGGR